MTKHALYLFSLILVLTSWSCCDEDDDPQDCTDCVVDVAEYTQLTVGNYWIYDIVKIDENGVDVEVTGTDSLYISGSTFINGNTYYIQENTSSTFSGNEPRFLRDSADFLVNHEGDIQFSTTIYDTVIENYEDNNSLYTIAYSMTDKDLEIDVPAGSFITSNFQGIVHFDEEAISVPVNDRAINSYYAKDIGLVKSNVFYATLTSQLERRLVRYYVQ